MGDAGDSGDGGVGPGDPGATDPGSAGAVNGSDAASDAASGVGPGDASTTDPGSIGAVNGSDAASDAAAVAVSSVSGGVIGASATNPSFGQVMGLAGQVIGLIGNLASGNPIGVITSGISIGNNPTLGNITSAIGGGNPVGTASTGDSGGPSDSTRFFGLGGSSYAAPVYANQRAPLFQTPQLTQNLQAALQPAKQGQEKQDTAYYATGGGNGGTEKKQSDWWLLLIPLGIFLAA